MQTGHGPQSEGERWIRNLIEDGARRAQYAAANHRADADSDAKHQPEHPEEVRALGAWRRRGQRCHDDFPRRHATPLSWVSPLEPKEADREPSGSGRLN